MRPMQTVVEIPDALVSKLAELARREGRSEADVVSAAVQSYVEQRTPGGIDPAFGLWRERAAEGLAYQDKLRAEWAGDESRF
jgi:predicted transcriptional regulator